MSVFKDLQRLANLEKNSRTFKDPKWHVNQLNSWIYIGSQLINALNSNLPYWRTTFSTLLSLLIYILCSIITVPYVLCVRPTPICCRFHVSAQPLPPAVLALQPPQFGTSSTSADIFHRLLKTHCFHQAYCSL